ncbi:MAG: HlyD family secretion protein [Propionibacteriaceae bacterium]|jgi:biotin carboxyl carrier protein|nr:HlyD family secretion protein [Propionibacteriaceae bacterium]
MGSNIRTRIALIVAGLLVVGALVGIFLSRPAPEVLRGTVVAPELTLVTRSAGTIATVGDVVGKEVEANALVVSVQDGTVDALVKAEDALEAAEQAAQSASKSKKALAEAKVARAQARVEVARIKSETMTIVAPVAGKVKELYVEAEDEVEAGTVVAVMEDHTNLYVSVPAPQALLSVVTLGQTARIQFESQTVEATVVYIAGEGDGNGRYEIRLGKLETSQTSNKKLSPGDAGTVEFI